MLLSPFSSPRRSVFSFGLGFVMALAALTGCGDKSRPAGRGAGGAAPVLAGKVARKAVPLTLDAIGAVEPIRTAGVRSQVTGVLLKVAFEEGQEVTLQTRITLRPKNGMMTILERRRPAV